MTIQISAEIQPGAAAEADVAAVGSQTGGEASRSDITASTARTVAAWYQSSGSVGSVLASFASGRPVDRAALLEDIDATVRHDCNGVWPQELELLARFVKNYESE